MGFWPHNPFHISWLIGLGPHSLPPRTKHKKALALRSQTASLGEREVSTLTSSLLFQRNSPLWKSLLATTSAWLPMSKSSSDMTIFQATYVKVVVGHDHLSNMTSEPDKQTIGHNQDHCLASEVNTNHFNYVVHEPQLPPNKQLDMTKTISWQAR